MKAMPVITKEQRDNAKIKNDNEISEFIKNNKILGKYVAMTPKSVRRVFFLAFTSKRSPTNAIKAKCLDCSLFDKKEITNCDLIQCPLWQYRPYTKKKTS